MCVYGQPGSKTCADCGAVLEKVLNTETAVFHFWDYPPHECPEMKSRLATEKAGKERREQEWLNNPPASRIAEVRRAVRLPYWTPAGMDALQVRPEYAAAVKALREHREVWLAKKRPERGLWLHGRTNRRKTASTAALAFDVAHRLPRRCLFQNFEDLMEQIRLQARGLDNRYEPSRIKNAHLLVLDDVGTVKITERALETLYGIINAAADAWGESEPTQTLYVTTNEDPAGLCEKLAAVDPESGPRIIRRMQQLCEVIDLGA